MSRTHRKEPKAGKEEQLSKAKNIIADMKAEILRLNRVIRDLEAQLDGTKPLKKEKIEKKRKERADAKKLKSDEKKIPDIDPNRQAIRERFIKEFSTWKKDEPTSD